MKPRWRIYVRPFWDYVTKPLPENLECTRAVNDDMSLLSGPTSADTLFVLFERLTSERG
jgi:hypothetical protein